MLFKYNVTRPQTNNKQQTKQFKNMKNFLEISPVGTNKVRFITKDQRGGLVSDIIENAEYAASVFSVDGVAEHITIKKQDGSSPVTGFPVRNLKIAGEEAPTDPEELAESLSFVGAFSAGGGGDSNESGVFIINYNEINNSDNDYVDENGEPILYPFPEARAKEIIDAIKKNKRIVMIMSSGDVTDSVLYNFDVTTSYCGTGYDSETNDYYMYAFLSYSMYNIYSFVQFQIFNGESVFVRDDIVGISANDVRFDNMGSSDLNSTDVQHAIEELEEQVKAINNN